MNFWNFVGLYHSIIPVLLFKRNEWVFFPEEG